MLSTNSVPALTSPMKTCPFPLSLVPLSHFNFIQYLVHLLWKALHQNFSPAHSPFLLFLVRHWAKGFSVFLHSILSALLGRARGPHAADEDTEV